MVEKEERKKGRRMFVLDIPSTWTLSAKREIAVIAHSLCLFQISNYDVCRKKANASVEMPE